MKLLESVHYNILVNAFMKTHPVWVKGMGGLLKAKKFLLRSRKTQPVPYTYNFK